MAKKAWDNKQEKKKIVLQVKKIDITTKTQKKSTKKVDKIAKPKKTPTKKTPKKIKIPKRKNPIESSKQKEPPTPLESVARKNHQAADWMRWIDSVKRVGRPTKYRPEFCHMILDYMERESHEVVIDETYYKIPDKVIVDWHKEWQIILWDMPTWSVKSKTHKVIANRFPTIERFAHSIWVHKNRLYERAYWQKDDGSSKYPEFQVAYERAIQIQEAILNENALQWQYNSQYSMFIAKNKFWYKDKQDIEHSWEINTTVRWILDKITKKKE